MRGLFWASQPESEEDQSAKITKPAPDPKPENRTLLGAFTSPMTRPDGDDRPSKSGKDWNGIINATDWTQFSEPRTIIPTALLTGGILFSIHIHRKYLRRIPEVANISPSSFRRRSILGRVTSVGDGDNFRLYHTPGGRLAGWDWLRKVPTAKKELKNRTIHIRLAGVDAPELAHFGRPAQPFSKEAHTWLTNQLINRRVRAYIYRPDQYGRVVGTAYVRKWLFFSEDIGLKMLRQGLATVYEAKTGVEFGGAKLEAKYRKAEAWAKSKKKGLWKAAQGKQAGDWESPREFKSRMAAEEQERNANSGGKG